MIKRDVIMNELRDRTGYTKDELTTIFMKFREIVIEHLRRCDEFKIFDGLIINGRKLPPTTVINPAGVSCEVPERIKIVCRVTDDLKKVVN